MVTTDDHRHDAVAGQFAGLLPDKPGPLRGGLQTTSSRFLFEYDVPQILHLHVLQLGGKHLHQTGFAGMTWAMGGSGLASPDPDGDTDDVDFTGFHSLSIPEIDQLSQFRLDRRSGPTLSS